MTQPEISLIIPVYNTAPFLDRCVKSVLSQTFTDFELILVDDGSTDGSGALCDGYAAGHGNVRALHVPNGGAARARKLGVQEAAGRLVTFIDSDDYLEPEYLAVLHGNMEQGGFDIVTCNYRNVRGRTSCPSCPQFPRAYIDCGSFGEVMALVHRDRSLLLGPVCKLFRRELLDGIDFHEGAAIGEDYCMCVEAFGRAGRVRCLRESLYNRVIQGGSMSHSGYTAGHGAGVRSYRKVRGMLAGRFPELARYITGYHVQYELAAVTAMSRSLTTDVAVLSWIRADLRRNMRDVIGLPGIPLSVRASMPLILICPRLFLLLYHAFYRLQSAALGGAQRGPPRTASPLPPQG